MGVALVGGRAWYRWCPHRNDVSVSIDRSHVDALAYTCPNGAIYIQIPGASSILLEPDDLTHSQFPGTHFYNLLGLEFTKDLEPSGVLVTDRIKIDPPLHVVSSAKSLAYDDLFSHRRVQIILNR